MLKGFRNDQNSGARITLLKNKNHNLQVYAEALTARTLIGLLIFRAFDIIDHLSGLGETGSTCLRLPASSGVRFCLKSWWISLGLWFLPPASFPNAAVGRILDSGRIGSAKSDSAMNPDALAWICLMTGNGGW